MKFEVVMGDITRFPADAIVNAANTTLLGGGGVDGAIHRAAGPQLLEYCRKLNGCSTGDVALSPAFDIQTAKYIIHTPGPRFSRGNVDLCEAFLAACYHNSLRLAESQGYLSIAFPSISTGAYAFPLDLAAKVVAKTFFVFRLTKPKLEKVSMVCADVETSAAYKRTFGDLGLT